MLFFSLSLVLYMMSTGSPYNQLKQSQSSCTSSFDSCLDERIKEYEEQCVDIKSKLGQWTKLPIESKESLQKSMDDVIKLQAGMDALAIVFKHSPEYTTSVKSKCSEILSVLQESLGQIERYTWRGCCACSVERGAQLSGCGHYFCHGCLFKIAATHFDTGSKTGQIRITKACPECSSPFVQEFDVSIQDTKRVRLKRKLDPAKDEDDIERKYHNMTTNYLTKNDDGTVKCIECNWHATRPSKSYLSDHFHRKHPVLWEKM